MIPLYIYGAEGFISFFALEIMEGGLDNDTQRCENGSARLGSAVVLRLFFSVSSSITSNRQVKSGSRVNYALISDFFCGKGACC